MFNLLRTILSIAILLAAAACAAVMAVSFAGTWIVVGLSLVAWSPIKYHPIGFLLVSVVFIGATILGFAFWLLSLIVVGSISFIREDLLNLWRIPGKFLGAKHRLGVLGLGLAAILVALGFAYGAFVR